MSHAIVCTRNVVVQPVVGGFVCDATSNAEWIEAVSRVWEAYYAVVGRGTCGVRCVSTSGVAGGLANCVCEFCNGVGVNCKELVASRVDACGGGEIHSVVVGDTRGNDLGSSVVEPVSAGNGSDENRDIGVPKLSGGQSGCADGKNVVGNGSGTVCSVSGGFGSRMPRGPNYERNKSWREAKKRRRVAGGGERFRSDQMGEKCEAGTLKGSADHVIVPWRKEPVPRDLFESWVKRKVEENNKAVEKIQKEREKMRQDAEDGTDRKKHEAEVALLDGQLSGKYSLAAPKHVIGYAKTLISATSGSNSTGAAKTVWSGSGASKKSRLSEVTTDSGAKVYRTQLEMTLEDEVKKLKIQNAKLKLQIPEPKGYQGDWY